MITKTVYQINTANELFAKQNAHIIANIVRCEFIINVPWEELGAGRLDIILFNGKKNLKALIPGLTWEAWYATNLNGFLDGKSFNQTNLIRVLNKEFDNFIIDLNKK